MLVLTGKPVSDGIGIGPLALFRRAEVSTEVRPVEDREAELVRFREARDEAAGQLQALYDRALETVGEEDAAIFEIHQMMLEDDEYTEGVETRIRDGLNAEAAVEQTAQELSAIFRDMDDEYMRGRAADVTDVSRRVEQILCGVSPMDASAYDKVVLAADDLAAEEVMHLDTKKILGVVLSAGSASSHTAILIRNLGIPAVFGVGESITGRLEGQMTAVDGGSGEVILNPDTATLAEMQEKQGRFQQGREELDRVRGQESVTLDGQKVRICANAGHLSLLSGVLSNDAEGIGLFRSEFIYLESDDYPTEEEQFSIYKNVLEAMPDKRVIIRTLDIGADKKADYFELEPEENPALGMRAIRICLTRPELFKTQLRALCRASVYGKLSVMFPMIISVEEVRKAKAMLREVREELLSKGIPVADAIETGIMIETPAAALISGELAREVDFFSIGTNDLTQYTLAIDRRQTNLDAFFDAHHPAVLRLIEMTVRNAHEAGIWVGICGELGADLSLTETFLRMGVDELSVAAASVLPLRAKVRSLDLRASENR
ncbi:MAG: phosphoenolpyruvate--protein phosphotransferase [Succiniclasticum sp.]|uniref:phosphoenolpyruvate--protein phosphotransferase n=1 Tax=Succiniclasticum sp. TaxID=2775030 RepID=UPI002A918BB7|nr:phosphoenolpyruvate--protein phosphotransferase [Succiniclasticum sp.]MBR1495763.1 phosphoenolpyruvate--protein phosphotransferase [Acidaminococcaceae bacterium]MDY6291235.1 phosphoenolpyruvate--protein phosphotransferase [Succiniclasticum sp.]